MEQAVLFVRRDTDARVAYRKTHQCLVAGLRFKARAHRDLAIVRELDRVAHKVYEHLAQAARIAPEVCRHVRFRRAEELQALFVHLERHHLGKIVQQGAQIKVERLHLQLARLDLGKIQNVVDDAHERFAACAYCLGVAALLLVKLRVQQ